jgi:PERQ amino acid-rich with GYF domain-containing protein
MSTTMQFGPEWMRPKTQTNSRSSTREPSPPPGSSPAGTSSYSALVTPPPAVPVEMNDATNPFKYSRDEMLRIYKEGGGRGGLGLEVERWEGVVRELSSDPIGLKEMSEGDKKVRRILHCVRRRPLRSFACAALRWITQLGTSA